MAADLVHVSQSDFHSSLVRKAIQVIFNMIARSGLIFVVLVVAAGWYGTQAEDKEEVPGTIGPVKVISTVSDAFYPDYWKNDPKIKPVAEPIDRKELLRTIPLIRRFVAEYPEGVLARNLKGLYLCKTLQFYGKDFGGTNSADGVYICVKTAELGYTNQFVLSSMHHEFSSILMRNYAFPKSEWAALNPKNFAYTEDAVGALGKKDLLLAQAKYHELGFVCLYSQSSMEEDFNTIADYVFNQRPKLLNLGKSYPKLSAKIQLAMKFYKSVDSRFSFGDLESLNK